MTMEEYRLSLAQIMQEECGKAKSVNAEHARPEVNIVTEEHIDDFLGASVSNYMSANQVSGIQKTNIRSNFINGERMGQLVGFVDTGLLLMAKKGKNGIAFYTQGISERSLDEKIDSAISYTALCQGIIRDNKKYIIAENKFSYHSERFVIIEPAKKIKEVFRHVRSGLLSHNEQGRAVFYNCYCKLIDTVQEQYQTGNFSEGMAAAEALFEFAESNRVNRYYAPKVLLILLYLAQDDFDSAMKTADELNQPDVDAASWKQFISDHQKQYYQILSQQCYDKALLCYQNGEIPEGLKVIQESLNYCSTVEGWQLYADMIFENANEENEFLLSDFQLFHSPNPNPEQKQVQEKETKRIQLLEENYHAYIEKLKRQFAEKVRENDINFFKKHYDVFQDYTDEYGMNALMYAVVYHQKDLMAFLSIAGMDKNQKNILGMDGRDLFVLLFQEKDNDFMEYLEYAAASNENYEAMLTEFYNWKNDLCKQREAAEYEIKKCQLGINGAKQKQDIATETIWRKELANNQMIIQQLTEQLNGADQLLLSKKRSFFEQSFWNAWMILSGWASLPELPAYCQPLPETASLEEYLALPVFRYQQMFEEEKERYANSSLKEQLLPKGEFESTEAYEAKKDERAKEAAFRLVKQSHEKKCRELALYAQKSDFAKLLIKSFYTYPRAFAELSGSYDADNQQFTLVWNGFSEYQETKIFVPDTFAPKFKEAFMNSDIPFSVLEADTVSGNAVCCVEFEQIPFYFYLSQKKTVLAYIFEECRRYSPSQADELKAELDSIRKDKIGIIDAEKSYEQIKEQLFTQLDQINQEQVDNMLAVSTAEEISAEKHTAITTLTQGLIGMTENIYAPLFSHMYESQQIHEDKLKILVNSQQANLDSFVENQKNIYADDFVKTTEARKNSLANGIAGVLPSYRQAVESQIDSKSSIDEIHSFIETRLSGYCSELSDKLIQDDTVSGIYSTIFNDCQARLTGFQQTFESYLKDANLMKMTFETGNFAAPAKSYISKPDFSNVAQTAQYVAGEIKKEDKAIGGGLAAGAAAGTAILPGIGTLVGGFLGGIAGAAASPDIDNVKTNVKQQLANSLNNYFQNTSSQIIASIDDYIIQVQEWMKSEMDGCLLKYREEVNGQITAEQTVLAVIQENIDKLQQNIHEINDRREKISIIGKQLSWIQKEDVLADTSTIPDLQQLEFEDIKHTAVESEILISKLKHLSSQMREFDSCILELS